MIQSRTVTVVQYANNLSGSTRMALALSVAFSKTTDKIHLVLPRPRGKGIECWLKDLHCERIEVFYAPIPDFHFHMGLARAKYLLDFAATLYACAWFLLYLLRNRSSLVIANTILSFPAVAAAFLLRRPLVWYIHEISIRPKSLHSFLKRMVSRCPKRVWVVSSFMKGYFEHRAIRVVPDTVFLPPSDKDATLPKDGFQTVQIGRVRAYKGSQQFVEVARHFSAPDFGFHLVGDGATEFAELTRKGSKDIPLWGRDETADVISIYEACQVVVNLSLPSLWVETFGLTLLEAMWFGKPVIGPDCGGPRELIRHGWNGFLVDPLDHLAISGHIRDLASDPVLYRQISGNAIETAKTYAFSEFCKTVKIEMESLL